MYNVLTEAIQKRFIWELRRFWSYDPNYREIVRHIQGKYSFREQPQQSIIIKNSSASTVQLAADNFQCHVQSYVYLQKVANYPGLSVEWVVEDMRAIQANSGVFPSQRGVYYIAVEQEEVDIGGQPQERLVFYVDPLLEVVDETPLQLTPLTWQLFNGAFHGGSLRMMELPGHFPMVDGVNYTVDPDTGIITLVTPMPNGTWLSVDYRYPDTSTGPWLIRENHSNVKAIPGVVLAFGRRVEGGDRLAVIIGDRREVVAKEYGGRWEISLDIDVTARDVTAQREIADKTVMYLWGVARNRLSSEGIEITQVNFGGEGEEIYDDTDESYFYNASISVTVMTDWAIRVPLDPMIRQVSPQTSVEAEAAAGLSDDDLISGEANNLQMVDDLRLINPQDPFFVGRGHTFEMIR